MGIKPINKEGIIDFFFKLSYSSTLKSTTSNLKWTNEINDKGKREQK